MLIMMMISDSDNCGDNDNSVENLTAWETLFEIVCMEIDAI